MDVNLPLRPVSTLVRSPNVLTGLKGKLTSICISKNIYILKKNITFKIIYFNFIGANKPYLITTTRKKVSGEIWRTHFFKTLNLKMQQWIWVSRDAYNACDVEFW